MNDTALIESLGLTPPDLAKALRISEGLAYDLTSGHRRLSLKTAAKIEEAFSRAGVVDSVLKRKLSA